VAAKTRNKAPARWTALALSGLASAGFLWGIVNAPSSLNAADTASATSPTPTAAQQVAVPRVERDDENSSTAAVVPSQQLPTTVQQSQPSQSTQPAVRTSRVRTRGS
jgi:hypothetical protein